MPDADDRITPLELLLIVLTLIQLVLAVGMVAVACAIARLVWIDIRGA